MVTGCGSFTTSLTTEGTTLATGVASAKVRLGLADGGGGRGLTVGGVTNSAGFTASISPLEGLFTSLSTSGGRGLASGGTLIEGVDMSLVLVVGESLGNVWACSSVPASSLDTLETLETLGSSWDALVWCLGGFMATAGFCPLIAVVGEGWGESCGEALGDGEVLLSVDGDPPDDAVSYGVRGRERGRGRRERERRDLYVRRKVHTCCTSSS